MKINSIEEKISYRLILLGTISMLLTGVLVIALFHRGYNRQVIADMRTHAVTIRAALRENCAPEGFATEEMRITIIAADGSVLYESAAVTEEENHLARPEVRQALDEGSGFSQRRSQSVGYDTTYFALLLENGSVLRIAQHTASIYAIYDSSVPAIVVILVMIMILAVVLSAAVSRSIVAPINKMAEHLDEIDEKQVPYKELMPFAQILRQDYELRRENEKMRMEFTANVSHELKTPLTSISGYAELLENSMVPAEDIPRFGARIHKEAVRMTNLVGDILKLSALDHRRSGKQEPERVPVDLAVIAEEVAGDLGLNAKNNYITIKKNLNSAVITGDEKLLTELCTNLVDNAIRYNRPGGWVSLSAGKKDALCWLEVADNGIGIPAEAQSRIFERFYRVDKSRSKATGGTGLGLAIVKHIAVLHDGKIAVNSQPGQGTTIRITFPKHGGTSAG